MAVQDQVDASAKPARDRGRIWQVLGLILAAYIVWQDVEVLLRDLNLPPITGKIGARFAHEPGFAPGWVTVRNVDPGLPMARAGIVVGDHLRFHPVWDGLRRYAPGDVLAFDLRRGKTDVPMRVVAVPRPPGPPDIWSMLNSLSCLPAVLVGLVMFWRSRRPSAMLLGAALLTYGLIHYAPEMLLGRAWSFLPLDILGALNLGSISVFFAAFAMRFYEETIVPLGRWAWRWFWAYAGLCLASTALFCWGRLFEDQLPLVGDGQVLFVFVSTPGFVAALAILLAGWKNSARELQKRFLLLAVASAGVVVAQVAPTVLNFGLGMSGDQMFSHPFMWVAYVGSGIVAPAFFAYAIVRHRVFDLGFVLNRTLVYGAVSVILLVSFGLLEWLADHVVRIQGRETNAALDAGMALGVFLTFHRVRDAVEHGVERLFFRSWQANEAALSRFVKTAGFIARPQALVQAFAGELARFTGGADAAVYLKAEDGDYRLAVGAEGLASPVVDADEPAVVVLRAGRAPLEPEEAGSAMTAALAVPMMNRAEVIGFALVGPKPAGLSYRPDEIAALAHAADQVGLDLYGLKVEQLEQRLLRLESAKPRRG